MNLSTSRNKTATNVKKPRFRVLFYLWDGSKGISFFLVAEDAMWLAISVVKYSFLLAGMRQQIRLCDLYCFDWGWLRFLACLCSWSGLVCCGMVWSVVVWSGLLRSGLVCCGLVWSGLLWSGLLWSGLLWSGLLWSGLVCGGLVWSVVVWSVVAWSHLLWPSLVWSVVVWSGLLWSGLVCCGLVWSFVVWSVVVWSGLLWPGLVWSVVFWSVLLCCPSGCLRPWCQLGTCYPTTDVYISGCIRPPFNIDFS